MGLYPEFGLTFAEIVWRTGIGGLQEVDLLASSAFTGPFLQQSASSQPSVPAWRRTGQCYQDVDLGLKELLLGSQPSFISLCSSPLFGKTV